MGFFHFRREVHLYLIYLGKLDNWQSRAKSIKWGCGPRAGGVREGHGLVILGGILHRFTCFKSTFSVQHDYIFLYILDIVLCNNPKLKL